MKKSIFFSMLICLSFGAHAQSFEDESRKQMEQLRRMMEQMAQQFSQSDGSFFQMDTMFMMNPDEVDSLGAYGQGEMDLNSMLQQLQEQFQQMGMGDLFQQFDLNGRSFDQQEGGESDEDSGIEATPPASDPTEAVPDVPAENGQDTPAEGVVQPDAKTDQRPAESVKPSVEAPAKPADVKKTGKKRKVYSL